MVEVDPDKINLLDIAEWGKTVERKNLVAKQLIISQLEIKSDHMDDTDGDLAVIAECLEMAKWEETVEWDNEVADDVDAVMADFMEIAKWDDIVEWDNEVSEPLMPQFEIETDQLNREDADLVVTAELMEIAQWNEIVEWDNVVAEKPIANFDSPKADAEAMAEFLDIAKWDEIVEWDTEIAKQPITLQSTDVAVLAEFLEIAQWDENVEWDSSIAVKVPNEHRLEINASKNSSLAEKQTMSCTKCYKTKTHHHFVDLTSLTNLSLNENDTPDVQNDRMQPLQTIGNVEIYRSDIDSLEFEQWLTDAIVDGWINLCAERSKFDHNCSIVFNFGAFFHIFIREDFKRKFSADLIAGTAADLMTFPVCISNHWTLVYADRRTMIITEYDPLQKRQPHRQILKDVKDFLDYIDEIYRPGSSKWIISESATFGFPRQTNFFDCGLFVLKLVECLYNNIYADYNQSQMTAYRFYVKATILSRTIVEVNHEVKEDPIDDFLTKEFLTGGKWDKTFNLNEIETINEVQFIGECRMILNDSPVNQCINISSPIDDKLSLCEISDQLGFGDLMFINNSIEIATQMDTSTQFEYPVELFELTTHNATTEIATFPILKELEKSNTPNLYSTRPVRIRKPPNRFMF